MILKTHLRGKVYEFKSLREVMGKANEEKSGDNLAGVSAESAEERIAAKAVLQHITLQYSELDGGRIKRVDPGHQYHRRNDQDRSSGSYFRDDCSCLQADDKP